MRKLDLALSEDEWLELKADRLVWWTSRANGLVTLKRGEQLATASTLPRALDKLKAKA